MFCLCLCFYVCDRPTGKQMTLEIDITLTSWNVAPGRRLALVVGTKDRLFLDQNEPDTTIKIMSGSVLSIPLHN